MNTLVLKQLLRLCQSMRDIEGAYFDTVVIKESSGEVLEVTRQTKAYGEGVRSESGGKGHSLAPPHIWAWGGLVNAMVKRGPEIGKHNHDTLKAHLEELNVMSLLEKTEVVRFCRVSKMFDPNLRRLTLSIPKPGLRAAMLSGLEQTRAERTMGRAPAGAMEREMQAYVDGLAEE